MNPYLGNEWPKQAIEDERSNRSKKQSLSRNIAPKATATPPSSVRT
uniref:Uncharacterized protein n=1 Tax=Arundo donax TaxID=35708 RepID=A0A0A8Y2J9_ARUDO